MQEPLVMAFVSVFAVSAASLVGVLGLALNDRFLRRIVFVLVSLSVGVLFGDTFIHIIPELYGDSGIRPEAVSLAILTGIVLFFVLEKLLHVGRKHGHGRDSHTSEEHRIIGPMVLTAESLHNFLDGIIITASYFTSFEVGVATTAAVMLHEIPQEIGDFGVLVHAGYSKWKAITYNYLSALAAFGGFFVAATFGLRIAGFADIALAIAAGGFIYIAGSDLVPELQKKTGLIATVAQLAAILAGFAAMAMLLSLE